MFVSSGGDWIVDYALLLLRVSKGGRTLRMVHGGWPYSGKSIRVVPRGYSTGVKEMLKLMYGTVST